MLRTTSRALHLLALASWFGSALFFNFLAAPVIFRTFKEVVQTAPNDRTANLPLLVNGSETEQAKLASGLAGAAVGPLFPIYFGLQSICVAVAFFTAFGWWYRGTGRPVERGRLVVLGMAGIATAISVPVSQYVTQLRTERLSLDPALAEAAVAAFGTWHLVSLALSFITTGLALVAIIYAARMPDAPAGTP